MARQFLLGRFRNEGGNDKSYVADRGTKHQKAVRFAIPPDLSKTEAEQIAAAAGMDFNVDLEIPCPEDSFTPRKLLFIRQSGNTLSVPIGDRANLLTARNAIRGILDAKPDNRVVCIRLIGEEFDYLNDELGVSWDGQSLAISSRPGANGKKQSVYSGSIQYKTDTDPSGNTTVTTTVKVDTENVLGNAPPACLGSVWQGCAGELVPAQLTCGGNNRQHRRYLLDFAVNDNIDGIERQSKELPVKEWRSGEILTCGQNAAKLAGLYCIRYRGESFGRFHVIQLNTGD
jgi:hypothetical protein